MSSKGMEQPSNEPEKKKVNEDLVVFMRKRSDHEVPRYTARLKTYVDIQRKRHRANNARRNSETSYPENKAASPGTTKKKEEHKDRGENRSILESADFDHGHISMAVAGTLNDTTSELPGSEEGAGRMSRKGGWFGRRADERDGKATRRSGSRSHSEDVSDACCRAAYQQVQLTQKEKREKDEDDPVKSAFSPYSILQRLIKSGCPRQRRRRRCRRRRKSCGARRRRKRRPRCRKPKMSRALCKANHCPRCAPRRRRRRRRKC